MKVLHQKCKFRESKSYSKIEFKEPIFNLIYQYLKIRSNHQKSSKYLFIHRKLE